MSEYKDTIWKHRVYGGKIRVSDWTETMDNNGYLNKKVYFYDNSKVSVIKWMDEADFRLVYEYVGKAKYTEDQLNKMRFEVEENE